MSGVVLEKIGAAEDGLRLDRWFRSHYPALTQARLENLLRRGLIRLDGRRAKANMRIVEGQRVRVPPEVRHNKSDTANRAPPVPKDLAKQLSQAVLHRDSDVLIINKMSGVAVQGGSKTHNHIDAALPALKFDAEETPRLVHRLDRDTSGILLLARHRKAAQFLTRQFANRAVEKIYWGLVHGVPRPAQGSIIVPLAKRAAGAGGERVRPVCADSADAMRAHTDYALIARIGQQFSWLAFRPHTGRTHQIRAHAAAIGHPLVGDGKYRGTPKSGTAGEQREIGGILPKKLHLHARSIMMAHPSGGMLSCVAPLTDYMAASWAQLELEEADGDSPAAPLFAGD